MRKLTLLLFALSGFLMTSCVTDSTEPDMVDPWLRERTPASLRLAGQVGAAVITDDWRHDDEGAISVTLVVDDISKVEVVELELQYNATADIKAGDILDLSSGSTTFTVTAETGETRTYTLTYSVFAEELEGVYSLDPLEHGLLDDYGPSPYVLIGGFDGYVVRCTPQDKSWQWNDGYQPNDEVDNVFSFKLEQVDSETGTTYGTCANLAGEDGNYANYVFANRIDVNGIYRLIPKGRSRWAKNVDGEITFYAYDDTEHTTPLKTVKQLGAGDHDWEADGNTFSIPVSEMAFYVEYPGPFNVEMDNWGDERFMALNVRDVFWRMKRDSDEPLADHNEQIAQLGDADKPAAPVGDWLKSMTLEGQIGTTEIDDEACTVAVRLLLDDVEDISAVLITEMSLNPSVTASVNTGDRIDLSSGSASFVATATNGDTRTYNITYTEFEKPATIEGTYRFSPIGGLLDNAPPSSVVIVGGWDYEGSPEVVMSTAMDKSWHWGDGYQPNDEEDNVISFKIERIEEDGTAYGTLVNYAGDDGKYANYVYDNVKDVNYYYRIIPEGRSRWSQLGDEIKIYAYNDVDYKRPVKTIGQLENGTHDFWGKGVPVAETAFYCEYPGPYDVIDWNWPDTRWMTDNIRDIFWLMSHTSGDPMENHDALLETLPDFVTPENPKPAKVSFAGVYDMDYDASRHSEDDYENGDSFALWFFGGSNDGVYCQSLMWKHWNWGDGYKPLVEDDNVLTIEQTGSDPDTGDEWGTCYNDAGPDGKYADFWWWENGGHDLKKFYRCIPEGNSTWRRDGATGRITFTAEDGTEHTATYYSEPTIITYAQDGKSFDCEIHYQALEFDVAGTPMEGWSNYSDYDKYVQNPMKFIVKLKKRE